MVNAVLGLVAICLWASSYGLFFAGDIQRWLRERPYHRRMSELERLAAVRAYAEWVRNMPPPPARRRPSAAIIPVPVVPPIHGTVFPYPGRRLLGD